MIIGFFKRNAAAGIIIVPVATILMWLPGFFKPAFIPRENVMPFYEAIINLLEPYPLALHASGILLVITGAFLLNLVIDSNEVLLKASYLTAFLYSVLMCAFPTLLTVHPVLFANIFLIGALGRAFGMYRKNTAFPNAFDAGFLVSIASLFYFPCIIFYFVILFSIIILRPFVWREWLISLFGLLVPYCFALTYYFVTDRLEIFVHESMLRTLDVNEFGFNLPNSYYLLFAVLGVLLIFSLTKLLSIIGSQSVKGRGILLVFVWSMLFGFIAFALSPNWGSQYLSILCIPFAVFYSNYLMQVKRSWWAEFSFTVLIIAILYNQFNGG